MKTLFKTYFPLILTIYLHVFFFTLRIHISIIGFIVKSNLRLLICTFLSACTFYLGFVYPVFFIFNLILYDLFIFALIFYISMKNEKVRAVVYSKLGKDFVIFNVGNPGKAVFRVMLAAVGGLFVFGADHAYTYEVVNPKTFENFQTVMEMTQPQREPHEANVAPLRGALQEHSRELLSDPNNQCLKESLKEIMQMLREENQALSECTPKISDYPVYTGGDTVFSSKIIELAEKVSKVEMSFPDNSKK